MAHLAGVVAFPTSLTAIVPQRHSIDFKSHLEVEGIVVHGPDQESNGKGVVVGLNV